MEITREQFAKFESVRESGVTNMFDVAMVMILTGLMRFEVKDIMRRYSELKTKFEGAGE